MFCDTGRFLRERADFVSDLDNSDKARLVAHLDLPPIKARKVLAALGGSDISQALSVFFFKDTQSHSCMHASVQEEDEEDKEDEEEDNDEEEEEQEEQEEEEEEEEDEDEDEPEDEEIATTTMVKTTLRRKRRSQEGKMRKKERTESYSSYIFKVLKQVHPNTGISQKGMLIVNSFVNDIFDRIATEAGRLVRHNKRVTLSSREIENAVKAILPGELAQHAVSEGTKAISKYTSYDEDEG